MNFKIVLADIDPNLIDGGVDDGFEIDARGYIYDHLLYYCSKFSPLPAIEVDVDRDGIRAARRRIYLKIAKDLERPTIRAVISSRSNEEAVNARAERGDIKLLDYDEVRSGEPPFVNGWHVFFFENDLDDRQLADFQGLVRATFEPCSVRSDDKQESLTAFAYLSSKRCVEFQALTPVENHAFGTELRTRLFEFDSKVSRILSYQGSQFHRLESKNC